MTKYYYEIRAQSSAANYTKRFINAREALDHYYQLRGRFDQTSVFEIIQSELQEVGNPFSFLENNETEMKLND